MFRNKFLRLLMRVCLYGALALSMVVAAATFAANRYINKDRMRADLENALSDFLQRKTTIESVLISWAPRPTLVALNSIVYEKDGTVLLTVPKLLVFPDLRRLLHRQVYLNSLEMRQPAGTIIRKKNGETNVAWLANDISANLDETPASSSDFSFNLDELDAIDAHLSFLDEGLQRTPIAASIVTDMQFIFPASSAPVTCTFSGFLSRKDIRAPFKGRGDFGTPETFVFSSPGLPLSLGADYWAPLDNLPGEIKTSIQIKSAKKTWWRAAGSLDDFSIDTASGSLEVAGNFVVGSTGPAAAAFDVEMPNTKGSGTLSIPNLNFSAINIAALFDTLDANEIPPVLNALRPILISSATAGPASSSTTSLTLSLKADAVSWNDLRAAKTTIFCESNAPGAWTASFKVKNIAWRSQVLPLFKGLLGYEEGVVTLRDGQFEGVGGSGTLNAAYGLRPPSKSEWAPSEFYVDWHLSRINWTQLSSLLLFRHGHYGLIESTGTLSGVWTNLLSTSLNGTLSLTIRDGIILDVPGIVKFLVNFNLQRALKTVEGTNQTGLPYDIASLDVQIVKGVVTTKKPAVIKSPTMDLALNGTFDLPNDHVEADMLVHFLTVFNEALNVIPGMKLIFFDGTNSMVPVWVKISGTLRDPKVEVQSTKSVAKGTCNIVISVLKIPTRLIPSFGKDMKDVENTVE